MKIHKRAMMDDLFDFFFTVIMAIFILMFLGFVLNGAAEKQKEITINNVNTIESYHNLHLYLSYPVKDHGNMADLITAWSYDDKYEDQLEEETEKMLNTFYHTKDTAWNLKIFEGDNELIRIGDNTPPLWFETRFSAVNISAGEKNLKVRLYLLCVEKTC